MRPILWTVMPVILSMPEDRQITFLHLLRKFFLTLLPLSFPQTLFMPSSKSHTIFDDQLKVKAEVHHIFTFAPAMVIFCTGVKGTVLVLGLNQESRRALCSLYLEKGRSGHGSSTRTAERAMDLGRDVLAGHPTTTPTTPSQIKPWESSNPSLTSRLDMRQGHKVQVWN